MLRARAGWWIGVTAVAELALSGIINIVCIVRCYVGGPYIVTSEASLATKSAQQPLVAMFCVREAFA